MATVFIFGNTVYLFMYKFRRSMSAALRGNWFLEKENEIKEHTQVEEWDERTLTIVAGLRDSLTSHVKATKWQSLITGWQKY